MKRTEVINAILSKLKSNTTYLEIGVRNGKCFFQIQAPRRIAVDPEFVIEKRTYLNAYKKNPFQWFRDSFYSVTSDEFFENNSPMLGQKKPSVVLIDGLHTYEQAYRDVKNALKVLHENGVIVMHDCNPKSEVEAFPTTSYEAARDLNLPGWKNVWCGDVWKAIVHLQTEENLEVMVLDTDFGLGLVRKVKGKKPRLAVSEEEIKKLSYTDLAADRLNLLNLNSKENFQEYLANLR